MPGTALQRVATEILASQPDATGDSAREAIHEEIAKRLRIDPMVKKAMEEAFAVVLNEFRDVTLKESPALESVRQQVHGVTGGQMREFAQRLGLRKPLTEEQILAWADSHYERTGEWPKVKFGAVVDVPRETWSGINAALELGLRGLPGKGSLARLLADNRGVRNQANLSPLSLDQILVWANEHNGRTGHWPRIESGPVFEAPSETWKGIQMALVNGLRGLTGGSSLAQLLAERRGARNHYDLPEYSVEQILVWADLHYERTGQWPNEHSGVVTDAPNETWGRINSALLEDIRGLNGGSSLARLLAEHRRKRNHLDLLDLTEEQILVWADALHARTGKWPIVKSGAVAEAPGETWNGIEHALRIGNRGLPRGSSLAQLLSLHRGVRNRRNLPVLTEELILTWADAHHGRTGKWPTVASGEIIGSAGETWSGVNTALERRRRGLSSGISLARLINERRKRARS